MSKQNTLYTTVDEMIKICLSLPNTYKDYPFRTKSDYCTIRHHTNKKIFAIIFTRNNKVWVNLKVEPLYGYHLRQIYKAIVPAFHMNKEHWISVILDESIVNEEIENLILNSYELTK